MISPSRRVKTWLIAGLRRRGIRVFGAGSLPRNLDLGTDLARLRPLALFRTVLDVGANTGQTARAFLGLFPQATVYSFEPVAATFRQLAGTFAENPRVVCEPVAMAERNGEEQMLVGDESVCARIVDDDVRGDEVWQRQTVTVVRLEDYARSRKLGQIDLLKTDTEGRDLNVLRGGDALLRAGAVAFVLCEVGFSDADTQHSPLAAIHAYLHARDFVFLGLYDPRDWAGGPELVFADALFAHRSALPRGAAGSRSPLPDRP